MVKQIIIGCLVLPFLVGCQTIIKKEVVPVDKPIAFIPKPPDIPKFVSEVDKLTLADIKDPGKVGIAYKYDTIQLRKLISIYELVLDQYRQSSANFDSINQEISALFESINKAEANKVDQLTTGKK